MCKKMAPSQVKREQITCQTLERFPGDVSMAGEKGLWVKLLVEGTFY